ncbi:hypothetical protein CDD80_6487 [Ophiocordyceps camponoti-rufipedis]|uniref:Uncharacterized protein n=1 Tax=Ophiocordyceps camponoti-rufipedis TaxID=2004952 RepID=A0A2C5Z9Y1_9HYPO|nr:hypothetical protein CDD80_6487 [Ophiocordyceps camponoti-rufipedis]
MQLKFLALLSLAACAVAKPPDPNPNPKRPWPSPSPLFKGGQLKPLRGRTDPSTYNACGYFPTLHPRSLPTPTTLVKHLEPRQNETRRSESGPLTSTALPTRLTPTSVPPAVRKGSWKAYLNSLSEEERRNIEDAQKARTSNDKLSRTKMLECSRNAASTKSFNDDFSRDTRPTLTWSGTFAQKRTETSRDKAPTKTIFN